MKLAYLILLVLLTACGAAAETDAVMIIDQTEKRDSLDAENLYSAFSNISHGHVTITEIKDQSMCLDTKISKPESPPYLFRVESKEREKDKQFKSDFMNGLDLFNKTSEGLAESNVYSVLASSCKKLSGSKAENKLILVFGDLFHNVKGEFSFYAFNNNPDKVMEDYEQIVEILEGAYPDIKDIDLSGIDILVVYYPSKENDRLYRELRKFWSRYFTEKNARIEFATSLQDGSQMSAL